MIKYKAKEYGIKVIFIDPRNTSKMCSKCGHISDANRVTREKFVCESCGYGKDYFVHADYNASVNIAKSTNFIKGDELEEEELISENEIKAVHTA